MPSRLLVRLGWIHEASSLLKRLSANWMAVAFRDQFRYGVLGVLVFDEVQPGSFLPRRLLKSGEQSSRHLSILKGATVRVALLYRPKEHLVFFGSFTLRAEANASKQIDVVRVGEGFHLIRLAEVP